MKQAMKHVQAPPRPPRSRPASLTTPIRSAALFLLLAVAWPIASPAQDEGASASARLAGPGPEHAWLDPLVGDWAVAMEVYPGPGADPIPQPPLTASREWILAGRYLREELRAGDTILRDATFGYDRLHGRFELVTVDAFEPGQMVYRDRGDATTTRIELLGESTEAGMGPEPTGRERALRFEITIAGPDENVQRIFVTYPGQDEFLFVEQRFMRIE